MKAASSAFLAVLLALCVPQARSQGNGEVYLSVSKAPLKKLPKPADAADHYVARREAAAASSAGDLLDDVLPVLVRRSNGAAGLATAGLRGFAAKQTAVFFDGMRVPADLTGTADLSALPAAGIERVEVLPGPWSSVQGADAEGGVINFISRGAAPGVTSASLGATLGSYGAAANTLTFAHANGRFKTSGSASRELSDGFQENGAARKEFFAGKAELAVGQSGRLTFNALRSNAENGVPGGTPVAIEDWNGRRERAANSLTDMQRSSLGLGRAALELPLSEGVRASLSAEGGVNRVFSHTAWGDELNRVLTSGGLLSFSFFDRGEAGLDYSRSLLKSDGYGDRSKQHTGLFAQWTLEPLAGLSVIPSLRYDKNVGYDDQASPRLALVYAPGFVWKFSAQTGRAWQAPTFADLYNPWVPAADRSPDLGPEHSWQTQAAVSANFAAGFRATLGAYYSDVKDRIALDASKSWAAYNLDSAFNGGVEGGLEYKGSVFSGSLGYVYNVSKGRAAGGYKALSFSPRHRASLAGAVKTSWLDIGARGYYSARQYTAADCGGLKLPAYFTADLYLSKTLERFEVFAGADNLLDAHYAQTADAVNGYYPLPGRVLKCGLSVRFI